MSSQDGCPRALPAPLGPTIHIGAARTLPGGHGGLVSPWGGRPWAFLPAAWALVSRATRMDDAAEDVSGGRTRVTGAKWSRRGGAVLCDMSSFFPSLATGSFWVSAVAWCPAEVPAGEHRHPGAMASSVPAPPPLREQAVSGRCKHPWEAEHVPRRGLRPPEPGCRPSPGPGWGRCGLGLLQLGDQVP